MTVSTVLTRREFAAFAGASLLARPALAQTDSLLMRAIPSTGERVPAVGLGTASIFDNANEATRNKAAAVIRALVENGAQIIDTASTYGDAEIVIGAEMAASNLREKIFIATKLESPDAAELRRSLARLFDQCSRGRETHSPIGGRCKSRCIDRTAVWPWSSLPCSAWSGDSRLGPRICRQLGTVLSEISTGRPQGDGGHSGDRRSETYDRQSWRDARPPAGCNGARKDDFVH